MQDLVGFDWADVCGGKRQQGDRLSVGSHEFDFQGRAVPVGMDHGTDVTSLELVFIHVASENHGV